MNFSVPTSLVRAWNRLLFRFRRDRLYRELAAEIEFHCSLQPGGMGNLMVPKEQCLEMWGFASWERLVRNVRFPCARSGAHPGSPPSPCSRGTTRAEPRFHLAMQSGGE